MLNKPITNKLPSLHTIFGEMSLILFMMDFQEIFQYQMVISGLIELVM